MQFFSPQPFMWTSLHASTALSKGGCKGQTEVCTVPSRAHNPVGHSYTDYNGSTEWRCHHTAQSGDLSAETVSGWLRSGKRSRHRFWKVGNVDSKQLLQEHPYTGRKPWGKYRACTWWQLGENGGCHKTDARTETEEWQDAQGLNKVLEQSSALTRLK